MHVKSYIVPSGSLVAGATMFPVLVRVMCEVCQPICKDSRTRPGSKAQQCVVVYTHMTIPISAEGSQRASVPYEVTCRQNCLLHTQLAPRENQHHLWPQGSQLQCRLVCHRSTLATESP